MIGDRESPCHNLNLASTCFYEPMGVCEKHNRLHLASKIPLAEAVVEMTPKALPRWKTGSNYHRLETVQSIQKISDSALYTRDVVTVCLVICNFFLHGSFVPARPYGFPIGSLVVEGHLSFS